MAKDYVQVYRALLRRATRTGQEPAVAHRQPAMEMN
jgi:hypothetical protein